MTVSERNALARGWLGAEPSTTPVERQSLAAPTNAEPAADDNADNSSDTEQCDVLETVNCLQHGCCWCHQWWLDRRRCIFMVCKLDSAIHRLLKVVYMTKCNNWLQVPVGLLQWWAVLLPEYGAAACCASCSG
jgi:hypothetical protein